MRFVIKWNQIASSILLAPFYLTFILEFFSVISIPVASAVFVLIGVMSFLHVILCRHDKRLITVAIFVFVYTLLWIISYFYNANADPVEILWPLAFFGIGTLLFYSGVPAKLTGALFIGYVFLLALVIIWRGGADNLGGSSSRNTISTSILLFFSIHMIISYKQRKSIPLSYPVLAVLGCLLGIGRSGVIMSVLIILFFVRYSYVDGKAKKRNIKLFLGVILGMVLLFVVIQVFFPELLGNVVFNFQWRKLESRRTLMWRDYLNKIAHNPLDLLLGASISGTYELDFYHDNLHNSFFMLHAKYGLGGLIIVSVMLFRSFVKMIKKGNVYLLTPFALILFRMNFDYTNFNGILDVVLLYYLVLYKL